MYVNKFRKWVGHDQDVGSVAERRTFRDNFSRSD